ncbi:MAG: hypothetical protein IJG85_05695 [Eubacteriaceae bacterium]|nr:hypothetical protein [Eubacteriaceae bacterium]
MKHRIKVQVPVEKRGLFGGKKTVMETRVIEVDGPTYRKIKKEQKKLRDAEMDAFLDEMDDLFGDW